jgi:hypothetical protein
MLMVVQHFNNRVRIGSQMQSLIVDERKGREEMEAKNYIQLFVYLFSSLV